MKKTFLKYNVNMSTYGNTTSYGMYKVNYQNTVNALGPNSTNRLMYIVTYSSTKHPYGNHAIVGYAYTRLMDSNGMGRAFIKVADGWSSSARYVEIDGIAHSSAPADYLEVYF